MILACTVRGCALPLDRVGGAFTCARGHAFDVARSGYVNLLQPQDRRSKSPGDSREAVAARRALSDAGVGRALVAAVSEAVGRLGLPTGARVADLGCGEGTHLGALVERFDLDACGVDVSVFAIEAAAKRHASLTWIVANADRRLPFPDAGLDLVLAIDGRLNVDEIARVLVPGGTFLAAVSAADDLVEVREAVLGRAEPADRASRLLVETADRYDLIERTLAHEQVLLDARTIGDLALATYRCGRTRESARLRMLGPLVVTLSHDVLRLSRAAR